MAEPRVIEIVAVVLSWRGRVGLFRRSSHVGSDQGLWHCITGYLEEGSPWENAMRELHEETGLRVVDLIDVRDHAVLTLAGPDGNQWRIHIFSAETSVRKLVLNWEHESYRWVRPSKLGRFSGQVPWLRNVLESLKVDEAAELWRTLQEGPPTRSTRSQEVVQRGSRFSMKPRTPSSRS